MVQFHESIRGAQLIDRAVPALVEAVSRLATATEEANKLRREANEPTVFDVEQVAGDLMRMANEYEQGVLVPGNEVAVRLRARIAELRQAPNAINVPFSVRQYLPPRAEMDDLREKLTHAAERCGVSITAAEVNALFACAAMMQGWEP